MRKRNRKLTIRLSDTEYERVIKKLDDAKHKHKELFNSYSDFILCCIDRSQIYTIKTSIIDQELKAIGKNINQWTKNINIFNNVDRSDVEKLEKEVAKIWQLLRSLKSEIKESMDNIHSKTS